MVEKKRNESPFRKFLFSNSLLFFKLFEFVGVTQASAASNVSIEDGLYKKLLSNYNPDVRPRREAGKTININVTYSLSRLDGLNIKEQTLSTTGWLTLTWKDDFLTWDPVNYSNITKLVFPISKIWHPEVAVDNSVVDIIHSSFTSLFLTAVYDDGTVVWEPGGLFSTICEIDITSYPYDHQLCHIILANWQYTADKVNLTSYDTAINMETYSKHGEWEIMHTSIANEDWMSSAFPEDIYPEVKMSILLKRQIKYYILKILIPVFMMSLLVLMVFHLPPDSGEKVSLGVTVLLSFTVFQLMIADNMPSSSRSTPLIQIYLLFFMAESTFSVAVSVLVLNLHHRTEYKHPPSWLKILVLDWMATLVLAKRCSNKIHPQLDSSEEYSSSESLANGHTSQSLKVTSKAPNIWVNDRISIPDNENLHQTQVKIDNIPQINTSSSDISNNSKQKLHNVPSQIEHPNQNLNIEKSMLRLMKSFSTLERKPSTQNRNQMVQVLEQTYQELCQQRKEGEMESQLENEWKCIAKVVDRFFFLITFVCILISSIIIFGVLPNSNKSP